LVVAPRRALALTSPDKAEAGAGLRWLLRGVLTNILTPKVGFRHVSLLPQFIPAEGRFSPCERQDRKLRARKPSQSAGNTSGARPMPSPLSSPPQPQPAAGWRPSLTALQLNLIVLAYLLGVLNLGMWPQIAKVFAGNLPAAIGFGAAVSALTLFALSLISLPLLHRPLLAFLILTAAVAEHFRRAYGVLIDREMIQNAMLTTTTESKHLFTAQFLRDVGLMGVLPAALVFLPRLRRKPVWHMLWRWPAGVALSLALLVGLLATDYKTYASAVREHREMLGAYQPGATVSAMIRYAKMQVLNADIIAAPYGRDAHPGPRLAAAPKPVLFVLFVGETARAQNFGLNGYARDTTPELAGLDVVNYPDASSCGTSTAVSVPCMFSAFGAADYSQKRFLGQENLVDILSHAGLTVEWIDNNTGDQSIFKRLGKATRIDASIDASACAEGECTDEAFLPIIRNRMQTITGNTVLVLHMIGSHGPAYSLRYPRAAAHFQPECRSAAFAECTTEEIVNAYDNSIRETDHVLAETIKMMTAQERVIPALVFISDHGESLGENGLYLHAAPMFMAPEVQRKVPFVIWLSEAFQQTLGVSRACLAANAAAPVSQDNLFHSVLGLLDIETAVREDGLDLSEACRKGGA